jgi:hypothetical protein
MLYLHTNVLVMLLVELEAALLHHAMVESNLYKESLDTAYKNYCFSSASNHQILKQFLDFYYPFPCEPCWYIGSTIFYYRKSF